MSRYAYRFGLLDIPNERSSHHLPIPRGGGIGILIAFVISSLLTRIPLLIWVPATLLALVSFFDDRLGLTAKARLFFQFSAACSLIGFMIATNEKMYPLFAHQAPAILFSYNHVTFLALSIYIVGTANFYNFMDGINGLAGLTGAVAFALLAWFAQFHSDSSALALSAACLSAACIGFLPLNIPQARVFMGDVGSILLGFVFSSFVVLLAKDMSDVLLLAGFLSTFYADTLTTLYIRKKRGENLLQAHRSHLYQLLANQKKIAHWKVSLAYALAQATIGIALLNIRPFGGWAIIGFELTMGMVGGLVMVRIRKEEDQKQSSL